MKPMQLPPPGPRQALIRTLARVCLASTLALQACGDNDATGVPCEPDDASELEDASDGPDVGDGGGDEDASRDDGGLDGGGGDAGTSDSGTTDSGGGGGDAEAGMDAGSADADAGLTDGSIDADTGTELDADAGDATADASSDAQIGDASTDSGIPPEDQCGFGSDDSRLLVPNADANDNPRAWTLVLCPRTKVMVGLGIVDLGTGAPELIDGVLPRCATPPGLTDATLSTNIAIDTLPENRQPGAALTEFSCAADQIVTGIAYAEAGGDFLDGVTVICTDKTLTGGSTTVSNPDLTTQLTSLLCPSGFVGIGLAYKDSSTDPNSDGTESVSVVCRPLVCF